MLYSLNKFLNINYPNNYAKAIKYKYKFISKYCDNINIDYLKKISSDTNNLIYLYTINSVLTSDYKNEIIGIVVIRKILYTEKKIRIYVPLISLRVDAREYGYGTVILQEIEKKFSKRETLEIVLLSLQSSVNFYLKLGFQISYVKFIEKNEILEDNVQMVKIIKFFS